MDKKPKMLIISGPTATGKTALAVEIAKKYPCELISADSRQIYQGLDIGVGKDHPKNVILHLIDIIKPNQKYSVAEFKQAALKTVNEIHSRGHLPILVGCSGFYIDSIINSGYDTFNIKPNMVLRLILNRLPVSWLKLVLSILDRSTFSQLNHSDINNPYRLIRKIEIKLSPKQIGHSTFDIRNFDILHISLTAPNEFIYQKIDSRVEDRLKIGHLKELDTLLSKYNWSDTGLLVSAYQSFKPYYRHKTDLASCVQKWKYLEHRDARHQKTWFKKQSAHFFDISIPGHMSKITPIIAKWYNKP
jgi:tRNA dimethylallyltransferase